MKVRIKFAKLGNLKFIGHLDVMRYFQKLNRRADLDISYSKGFSPHQEMSFATPLGVGVTSEAEYVDIEFESLLSKQELISKMNAASVPELVILDACLLPEEAKNAMASLKKADYTLSFREGHAPEDVEEFFRDFEGFLSQPEIVTVKQTKKNQVEVDLKAQIRHYERREDQIFLSVDTGSSSNLNPAFLMETYYKSRGEEVDPFRFSIHRVELYGEDAGEEKPLLDFGADF